MKTFGYIDRVVKSDFFFGKDLFYFSRAQPVSWFFISEKSSEYFIFLKTFSKYVRKMFIKVTLDSRLKRDQFKSFIWTQGDDLNKKKQKLANFPLKG